MSALRIGSMCSGYEGLGAGVVAVIGGELAWVADSDPDASKVLAHRFPGVPNLGDISKVDWFSVAPVDIAVAGTPCQDVSQAGTRAGMKPGTRSGVFLDFIKAVAVLKPRLVVIENVLGLLTARGDEPTAEHLAADAARDASARLLEWVTNEVAVAVARGDSGRARKCRARAARVMGYHKRAVARCQWHERRLVRAIGTVLGSLASLGFDAEWQVVSASDAGAPHQRKRVFVVAWPAADPVGGELQRRRVAAEDPDGAASGERRLAAPGQTPGGRSRPDAGGPGGARAVADTHGGGRGRRLSGVPEGQRDAPGGTPADPEGNGRDQGRPEPARVIGGPDASVGGDAVPADAERCGRDRRPQDAERGPEGGTAARRDSDAAADAFGDGLSRLAERDSEAERPQADHADRRVDPRGRVLDWGPYAAAIGRWERILGRSAPRPTVPSGKGGAERLNPVFVEWMQGIPEGWVTGVPGLSRNAMLKILGNGCVPQQVALAVSLLAPEWAFPVPAELDGAA